MRFTIASTLVLIGLLVAGCGGGGAPAPTASNSGPAAPPAPPGAPGAPAPPPAPGSSAPAAGSAASTPMPGAGVPAGATAGATTPGAASMGAAPGAGMPAAADTGLVPMPGVAVGTNIPTPGAADITTPAGADTGIAGAAITGPAMPGMTGAAPGARARKTPPKSLKDLALDAFASGNDAKGYELLHTYYAVIPTAGEELAEKMAWNPGLLRPALGPRFAIGAIYNPPSDFEESPQPIGSIEAEDALAEAQKGSADGSGKQKSRRLGDRRRASRKSDGSGGPAATPVAGVVMPGGFNATPQPKADEDLDFYTGEFGTAMLDALKARFAEGTYGLAMQDLVAVAPKTTFKKRERIPQNNANADPAAIAGAAMAPPAGVGLPAMVDPANPGGVAGQHPGQQPAEFDETAPRSLAPAIAWVGTSKDKDELVKRALRARADVLITYEITIRPATASKFIQNSTKLRLSSFKPGADRDEVFFTSATLNNRTVIENRKEGSGEDLVEKEINRAIAALDEKYTAAPLPDLVTPERAAKRIQGRAAANPDDPLEVLVEARFYTEKGLLKQDEYLAAAVQLLGEEKFAQMLAQMPGAGTGQMVGDAVSLGGIIDLMRGVNSATDAAEGAVGLKPAPGSAAQPAPPKAGGGLGSLLPFGLGGTPPAKSSP